MKKQILITFKILLILFCLPNGFNPAYAGPPDAGTLLREQTKPGPGAQPVQPVKPDRDDKEVEPVG